jgi:hypothetical protein
MFGVFGVLEYYDKVVRGTEQEDSTVILQFLRGRIGSSFTFLNYYKEIPVSYDATLLNVEHQMAEFAVHEYQAKVIDMEKRTLVYKHPLSMFPEDMIGEAFYVSSPKKRVILCNFGYATIRSVLRKYVRVRLDNPLEAELVLDDKILKGSVKDLSLGGAAISFTSAVPLEAGLDANIFLKLPQSVGNSTLEVGMSATIVKVIGTSAPYRYIVEFHAEKHSQQQIAYFINQRQVEIIKELRDVR